MLTSMFNLQDNAITVTSNFYIRKKIFSKNESKNVFKTYILYQNKVVILQT